VRIVNKRAEFLPFAQPYYDNAELDGITAAIKSGWWTKGPKTAEFEEAFAKYVGAKYALAVNSCTAALHLSLVCMGIGPGDEVITTPMTFCASANTIVHAGATPVFADIDVDTGLINPREIEKKITKNTKAILPVHYAGQACDMAAINKLADAHGLKVIEDAAHAVYTTYKDAMIGGSNTVAFSFYANKNLSTGEGGMLTSDDEELIDKARVMSLHGMSKGAWNRFAGGSWKYEVLAAGYKYNITDIAASLGLAQLDKLESMQATRRQITEIYDEYFAQANGIIPLKDAGHGRHSNHLYIIRVDGNKISLGRDEFIETLNNDYNIGVSVHYIPVHLQPFYRQNFGTKPGDYAQTEQLYSQVISLPIYPSMTKGDAEYAAQAVCHIANIHTK